MSEATIRIVVGGCCCIWVILPVLFALGMWIVAGGTDRHLEDDL